MAHIFCETPNSKERLQQPQEKHLQKILLCYISTTKFAVKMNW